jgi:hypothetical protein
MAGSNGNGTPLVLDMTRGGQRVTGRLVLADRPADTTDGNAEGETFSFKADTVDGPVVAKGRLIGDEVELTVEGVGKPLMLKRVK